MDHDRRMSRKEKAQEEVPVLGLGQQRTLAADAEVVDCTGPRQGPIARDPLLGALILSGVARPDAFGIGIEVSPTLRVRTASGAPHSRGILAIGPITGALGWETYAVPEIRRQCARVASELATIAMAGASVRRRPFRYAPG